MNANETPSELVSDSPDVDTKTAPVKPHTPPSDGNTSSESKPPRTVNLLDLATEVESTTSLELVRVSADETTLILFTPQTTEIYLHYCSEPDIQGYVRCQEKECLLCRIGRKQDRRLLLPVYLPTVGSVGVLPISPSMRPHALLPQLINLLKTLQEEQPQVVFIRREGNIKFSVSASPLSPDADAGDAQIKHFLSEKDQGVIDIVTIYPQIDNDQLKAIPEISQMMKLKGISG